MISLETSRLFIREVREEDFLSLLAIYTCRANMAYISTGKYDWTEVELKEKYNRINDNYRKGYGLFVVEEKQNKITIGEAGLFNSFQNQKILELGYIIDNAYWRKGFGFEVCNALIRYAFDQLETVKIVARMYAENIGSVSLSEKIGMKKVETGQTSEGKTYYRYELDKQA